MSDTAPPLNTATEGSATSAKEAAPGLELPRRILVVDDDPMIRKLLESTLRAADQVIVAKDGEEALAAIHEHVPDFIVTDINMPRMDGLELIRLARQSVAGSSVPIMALTGASEQSVLVEAFRRGADDYLQKPFSMSELRVRVAAIHMRQTIARDVNPLTKLPGNTALKAEIERRLKTGENTAVAYFDLDHFKEFNDTQGFDRGDLVISLLGNLLRHYALCRPPTEVFVGHVGGDDFVMVLPEEHAEAMAKQVTQQFGDEISGLYTAEEVERGTFRALNRKGVEEEIPILSVSVAIALTSRPGVDDVRVISNIAAELKKVAKSMYGNSFFIDRRKFPVESVNQ